MTEIRPPNQEEQEVVEVKRKPSAVVRRYGSDMTL